MQQQPVPFNDLRPGLAAIRDEIDEAIRLTLDRGRAILGPEVEAFEQEFAAYVGASAGIGVASGTDALRIGLLALEVKPEDEVIVVANAGIPPVAAVELAGAHPVLVDIDPATHTMSPEAFEAAITPRTRAVIVVHLYGRPAAIESIVAIAHARGIRVLEDCAQAHGASIHGQACGSFGDAAAFSFYPTKNLGAYGDGGLLVSSDPGVADRARLLRQYGWRSQYLSEITGMNSRLDEIQAAILRVRLRHLDAANNARRALAQRYIAGLAGLEHLLAPLGTSDPGHVYHLFVVQTPQRDALRVHLAAREIGNAIHYPLPVHLQPAYQSVIIGPGGLGQTERAAVSVLSLPMFPELPPESVDQVTEACRELATAR